MNNHGTSTHAHFSSDSLSFLQHFSRSIWYGDMVISVRRYMVGHNIYTMSLDQKDVELIERIIYKHSDDIAVSIARSFERLEERIDAGEARTYSRIAEVEDRIEAGRQDTSDLIGELKEEVREVVRMREM